MDINKDKFLMFKFNICTEPDYFCLGIFISFTPMNEDEYLNEFNKIPVTLLHQLSVTLLCWEMSVSNWSRYWGIYTRNVFWAHVMKCDFSCTPEVLTKQEQEMYEAVSEPQNKILLLAYFIFQDDNSSQVLLKLILPSFTTIAFYTYVPSAKISSFDFFFSYSHLLITTKMILNLT